MKIFTDSFFTIGKTHVICQDYAEAGEDHVVLSDGCSSANDTHIGAMLLVRATRTLLSKFPETDAETNYNGIIATASSYADALQLSKDALFATLLSARLLERDDHIGFRAQVFGDGVVCARKKETKTWIIKVYSFKSGAPYYLRYSIDDKMEAEYIEQFGKTSIQSVYELSTTGEPLIHLGMHDLNELRPFTSIFPLRQFDTVIVCSDGVQQFQRLDKTSTSKRNLPVALTEVLTEILAFKNFNGKFVQRRCQAAWRKFAETAWNNLDDVAIAGIHVME